MAAACGQEQVARAQSVADGEGQRQVPQRPPGTAAHGAERLAPGGRDEVPGRIVQQLLRPARVQLARDLDGGEQAFASGRSLERQPKESRPILAQVAVARGQFVHQPALLQPGKGATVRRRLAQLLLAHVLVERADRRLLVSVEQGVHGGQQRIDAGPRAPAQAAALVLKRQARPPFEPRHVLVVHGHGLIEQGLAGLNQERCNQGVALRRGKALQGLGVVSPAELGKVLQQLRRRRGKVHPGPQQPIQQVELGEAGRNRGGTCCWRGFLEA